MGAPTIHCSCRYDYGILIGSWQPITTIDLGFLANKQRKLVKTPVTVLGQKGIVPRCADTGTQGVSAGLSSSAQEYRLATGDAFID